MQNMATNNTSKNVNIQSNAPLNSSFTGLGTNNKTRVNDVSDDKLDHLKIFENLSKVLIKLGKETYQSFDPSNDQTIGYVPLQIAMYNKNNNIRSLGHFLTVQEILELYQKPCSDNLQPAEFFEKSKQFILESHYYQMIESAMEKENYLDIKSKIIGVIGQAGVGKSTLIKNLIGQFYEKGQLFQAKYVFAIDLRDFYDKPELSLFQFLLGENSCDSNKWTNDEKVCKEIFQLLTDCDSVCILLDGLDEAEFKPEDNVNVNASNFFKQQSGNFLLSILCGQLFPKAKKVITSRPRQMLDLPAKYKPKFILNILGVTHVGLNRICQNICGNHASQVCSQIENQPDLKSYTLVPTNCVLIVHCIYKFLLNDGDKFKSLPNKITDVYVLSFFPFLFTKHLFKNCNKLNLENLDHLKKISQLAWSGLRGQKFRFNNDDLKDAGLDAVDISRVTVTLQKCQNLQNHITFLQKATSNCTCFSDLLVQEFFSAIYCLFFIDSKTFKHTFFSSKQFDLKSKDFLMVTKFLFGLSNSETLKALNQFYPNISNPTKHIELLKSLARNTVACKDKDECDRFRSILHVCSWVYEFHDPMFSKQMSEILPTNIEVRGDILPSDVLSFCYVLKTRTKPLNLSVNGVRSIFVGKAFGQLLSGLQCIQTNTEVQLKMHDVKIDEESIETLCNLINEGMRMIGLYGCNLTARGIEKVSTRISNLTCPLPSLHIPYNNIGDSGFRSVAACVDKIKCELWIGGRNDGGLTLDGVKALIEKIKTSPFRMEMLYILCRDKLQMAVRQELLGLKNKVDQVMVNQETLFDDRSNCSIL